MVRGKPAFVTSELVFFLMTKPNISFILNGRPIEVSGRDALLPLTKLLRERLGLRGTKVVCAEGDCGACTVLLGRRSDNPGGGSKLEYKTADACILFAFQCHGAHVVSIEGLRRQGGGTGRGLTVIQEALVAGHGSQCGFCTPGIVMALHGQVEREMGGCPLEETSVRCALSGNLCRCTGYQQIFDACAAVPVESVDRLSEHYDEAELIRHLEKSRDAASLVIEVPRQDEQIPAGSDHNGVPGHWAGGEALPMRQVRLDVPESVDQALTVRDKNPGCLVVAGATDVGVWHNHGTPWPDHVLSLGALEELAVCRTLDDELSLGAGASWDRVIRFIRPSYPGFVEILERFGSPQIREVGTIGGNIVNGSPIADSLPFLFVLNATIEAASLQRGRRYIPISEFFSDYKQNVLEQDELLLRILLPRPKRRDWLFLEKISKRRDMDISTFTAGMNLQLSDDRSMIEKAAVALGGVAPVVTRLPEVEAELTGKPMAEETFRSAGRIARGVITPITDVRGHADFRLQLAENIFIKAFYDFTTREVAS